MPIFLQLQCLLPVSAIQVRLLIKKVCCTIQDIHHCNSKRQIIFLQLHVTFIRQRKNAGLYLFGNDYWLYHDPNQELNFANIHTRKMPNIFSFPKWLEQYQLFMGYMSQFIIPVYEWCFVNMLLETIEHKYPTRNHTYHLYQGIELLASYMNKNSNILLSPIIYEEAAKTPNDLLLTKIAQKQNNFPKKRPQGRYLPQELSMTKKMDWLQFDDTLNDVFQILLSNFYSGNQDKELNLKLLNPSYFKEIHNLKTKKSINPYTNTSYLRNCYIDLIRYNRLT